MARNQIKKMVEDSKASVRQEFDRSARSVRDEVAGLKKSVPDDAV